MGRTAVLARCASVVYAGCKGRAWVTDADVWWERLARACVLKSGEVYRLWCGRREASRWCASGCGHEVGIL